MAIRIRLSQVAVAPRLWYRSAAKLYSNDSSHDTAGSVRGAGGAFSKKEKAIEDQYFHNLEVAQLAKIKEERSKHHEEEIEHHEDAIEDLEDQIKRHKDKIKRHELKLKESKSDD